MRGQHSAVAVQQRPARVFRLALPGPAGKLQMGFRQVCHRAAYPAVTVGEQPAVRIKR